MSITLTRPRHAPGPFTALSPLRVAIVGPRSDAGLAFADAFARAGAVVRVVAVVEPEPGPWQHLPVLAGAERFAGIGALVAGGMAVDLLVLAASPESHADVVERAVEQGWHVLCSQPFTYDMAVAHRLVTAAATRDRRLLLAAVSRFVTTPAQRAIAAGQLGPVRRVAAWWWRAGGPGADRRWLAEPRPVIEGMAAPLLDLALPLFGASDPRTVRMSIPGGLPIRKVTIHVAFDGGGTLELTAGVDDQTLMGSNRGAALTIWGDGPATAGGDLPITGDPGWDERVSQAEVITPAGVRHAIDPFWTLAAAYDALVAATLQTLGGAPTLDDDPALMGVAPLPAIVLGRALRESLVRGAAVDLP